MNQSKDLFEEHFKHDMLSLVSDKVLNVRIVLARALRNHFKQISCNFMNDPFVNQAVKVMKQDKCQDVLDLVQEIQSYLPVSEESSNSSKGSETSTDNLTVATFMDTLNRSRRSSSSTLEGEISQMEESIIEKSGIEISKNTDAKLAKEALSSTVKAEEEKKESSNEPPTILAASNTITTGTEEVLPVKRGMTAQEKEEADAAEEAKTL